MDIDSTEKHSPTVSMCWMMRCIGYRKNGGHMTNFEIKFAHLRTKTPCHLPRSWLDQNNEPRRLENVWSLRPTEMRVEMNDSVLTCLISSLVSVHCGTRAVNGEIKDAMSLATGVCPQQALPLATRCCEWKENEKTGATSNRNEQKSTKIKTKSINGEFHSHPKFFFHFLST